MLYTGPRIPDCEDRVRKWIFLFAASLFLLLSTPAVAEIASIHASALPQESAVLAALDDAQQMEPYSHSWSSNWRYPITKDEVATRLGKDLAFLLLAQKNHPENTELNLLTGLVAHFAYNVDVPNSYDAAMNSLAQASKQHPEDLRGTWFHASMLCQTSQPKGGAEEFLSLESSHPWNQLPIAFWDDYLECATVTNMPAHALRASSYLTQLHAPLSAMRDFLTNLAHKRFVEFDPKTKYEAKQIWWGSNADHDPAFTGTSCGISLRAHPDWSIENIGLSGEGCFAIFSTGPYPAVEGRLAPEILLIARQPKENETLQQFAAKFTSKGKFEPITTPKCPSQICISMRGIQQGMYGKNGDGHGEIVVFERNQPDFPGLIFEAPTQIPKSDGKTGKEFYRPSQTQQRMPGKLYYLVLLDTASSIEEPATKDFDFFLQNLTVE